MVKTLLLYEYPKSLRQRIWIFVKIFIKEGLIYQQWANVFKNRKTGGSIVIPQNLVLGFKKINQVPVINQFQTQNCDVVWVLKDVECLKWALKKKQQGLIKTLIVGPFISTLPHENKGILINKSIDALVFLSQWHKNLFLKEYPLKDTHSFIWFAGVDTEKWFIEDKKRENILIYEKSPYPELYKKIYSFLDKNKIEYERVIYNAYTPHEYKDKLSRAKYCIFLTQSETQGLAMFEAWSCDVPTLHWNEHLMKYFGKNYPQASSAPYLSPLCGLEFSQVEEFENTFKKMSSHDFNPRDYVLNGFTLQHSAKRFWDIVMKAKEH